MKNTRFNLNSNVLGEYISWLLQYYSSFSKNLYKITDKKICDITGQTILSIQVAGKGIFLTLNPTQIAADDKMLSGFSAVDIRTITYLACKAHPTYKILTHSFSARHKKQMLVIENTKNQPELMTLSAQALSTDPGMIDGFSPREAHQIGFAAGMDSVVGEVLPSDEL